LRYDVWLLDERIDEWKQVAYSGYSRASGFHEILLWWQSMAARLGAGRRVHQRSVRLLRLVTESTGESISGGQPGCGGSMSRSASRHGLRRCKWWSICRISFHLTGP